VRLDSAFRALFFVYCLEAGLFLAVLPWTPTWDRLSLAGPAVALRAWLGFGWLGTAALGAGWLRGLASGFGLVHLVWAAHDLDEFLRRNRAS
jgi:hypothetical protein